MRTISIFTHHKGKLASSNNTIVIISNIISFAVLISNTRKYCYVLYRCIPRWSLLPGYGIWYGELWHVLMREFEGTDVTRQNLVDRFYDSSWISVTGIEECAR